METLSILNIIPQYKLNLIIAHEDTLKEIYRRLAKIIYFGSRITAMGQNRP